MSRKNIAIIGSGIAGIACAIRLANSGHQVTIFEANSCPGGKLTSFTQDGYRFDAGPSLFTQPFYIDELLNLTGKNSPDIFAYTRLPIVCKYLYEDGTVINGYADVYEFAQEIYNKTGVAPEMVIQHLGKSAQLYKITSKVFLENSLHRFQTYLLPDTLSAIPQLYKLNMFTTMHGANVSRFKDPKVVQLFDRFATYNGSNPYIAPATLNIIPHLEHNIGAYFPGGGMQSITNVLYQLAKEEGVDFRFNANVQQITVENKKAKGVVVDYDFLPYDTVISNSDVWRTYRNLMPDQTPPEKILNRPKSSSAIIFYWGINRLFPQLDLHNIFFSRDYQAEFRHIFKLGELYHDPTVYLNISSKYCPEDAPPGCENWFVMINVSPDTGQNWAKIVAIARAHIIDKLNRILQINLHELIVTESVLDPTGIENKTGSHQGALYGSNSNSIWSAFFRHPNFSSKISNLYFCGGSVHPGGGIPLCLQSAKIVARLIGS
ncbi:MAG: phytoene desaturase [Sphingobacteriales bacterium]|nr:MAG: phytoene desaturase [Sphingobacteriales bacterium]